MNTETPSTLIALVGGSGAGKSWLAARLRRAFGGEATSLSLDDFYCDLSRFAPSEREKINFDHPDAIDWPLFESVLRELRRGVTALAPRYSFFFHTRAIEREPCRPRPFIFVEGLWLLWPPRVRELFDLRIFLDCAESLRWQRRLARDRNERGRTTVSICEQFLKVVAPMHERFVEVQKAWADLVIKQPISHAGLGRLIPTIRARRAKPAPALFERTGSGPTAPGFAALQFSAL
jgi:uridine kinase